MRKVFASSGAPLAAALGYVVVGPRYSLAPEHRYPTPPRQMMKALDSLHARS